MTIVEMRQNMKLKELIHNTIKEDGCGIIITSDTSYGYGKQLLTKTVVFCTVLMLFLSNCTF